MDREQQVEVSVLVGDGEVSLRLNGASFNIRLREGNGSRAAPHFEVKSIIPAAGSGKGGEALLGAPAGDEDDAARLANEAAYYRQTSQEIYEGLGKLAKEINLSIQDLSLAEIVQTNATSPGENLDQVRSQVADVMQMTEKATLNILTLVEHIGEDCLKVQGHLLKLADGTRRPKDASEVDAGSGGTQGGAALWSEMADQSETLDRKIREQFGPVPSPGAALRRQIALPDILQLILDFCRTDAVKPHLKSVLAQYETLFQVDQAELSLARLAAEMPQGGESYGFPVDKVLTILQETCLDERIENLFTKLLASAAKVFPTPSLPLEYPPPESPPASAPQSEVAALWGAFYENFQRIMVAAQEGLPLAETSGPEEDLQEAAREAVETVAHIQTSLSRITEALAFQDLSGQRLLKVLRILRQLQVQVLTLLVAAGNKLKANLEGKEMTFTQSKLFAQEELHRMLHTCTQPAAGPGLSNAADAEQPLNQEAINELLTGMGF